MQVLWRKVVSKESAMRIKRCGKGTAPRVRRESAQIYGAPCSVRLGRS